MINLRDKIKLEDVDCTPAWRLIGRYTTFDAVARVKPLTKDKPASQKPYEDLIRMSVGLRRKGRQLTSSMIAIDGVVQRDNEEFGRHSRLAVE